MKEKELAEKLHSILCRANHTDGCGWAYESDTPTWNNDRWTGSEHKRWLEKAHWVSVVLDDYGVNAKVNFIERFFMAVK